MVSSEFPRCSAKGCRADAAHAVVWNNPKLHTQDREKVWLACDDHVEAHSAFLGIRAMLRYVETVADRVTRGAPLS